MNTPSDTPGQPTPDHGVPDGATDAEPKGMPTAARHESETAAHEKGGNASAGAKHSHSPEG